MTRQALLLGPGWAGCLVAAAALASTAPAAASETAAWLIAGRQGLVQVVIVPPAHVRDAPAYRAELGRLCPSDGSCFVNFYENPTAVPVALPLPDAIAQTPTARFRRSGKNGSALFQWSCRIEPGAADNPCF